MSGKTFAEIENVDQFIKEEQDKNPRCRQTAAMVLVSPDLLKVCLYMPEKAEADGRLNWCPPQGGIKPGETVRQAAVREVGEEFSIATKDIYFYLGSQMREFTSDHPKAADFDSGRYHWSLLQASSYDLIPGEEGMTHQDWHRVPEVWDWCYLNMSTDKVSMLKAALLAASKTSLLAGIAHWQALGRKLSQAA